MEIRFPQENEIPANHCIKKVVCREYLAGGEIRSWDGELEEVLSPVMLRSGSALERVKIGSYPLLGAEAAKLALDAAVNAYNQGRGAWPTMTVGERIEHVLEFTRRMVEKRTEVVRLLMWEIGKSLADSEKEFDRTVQYIKDTVEALKELDRRCSRFEIEEGIIAQIRRAPLGIVLCMGPFNYPLNETFTTLIPALIMGNAVILKPPKLGVLLYTPLLEAFRESFPPGVMNVLFGTGQAVVTPLLSSGQVDVLAFIGSSRVAGILKKLHPKPYRLRSVLGLNAKNAGIVLENADIDTAVKECVTGTLSFNGQRCTALKMLFVQRKIADLFLEKFVTTVDSMKAGMPWDQGVQVTPLPEVEKPQFLTELIQEAVSLGGKVLNKDGGKVTGSFFNPAVVYPVSPKAKLYTEEQFGPVIPVVAFDDVEEAIEYVVQSSQGQQVSVFGSDASQLAELIDPLVNQVCRVNINAQCQRGPDVFPFTGRKDSAEGTLSVSDALRVFSIRTLVATKDSLQNKELLRTILTERQSKFLSTDFLF